MTVSTAPNLGLFSGWNEGDDHWGDPMNENLDLLDAITQLQVLSATVSTPPLAPAEGDRYIVPANGVGAWVTLHGYVVVSRSGFWTAHRPRSGWVARVRDQGNALVLFDGVSWGLRALRDEYPADYQDIVNKDLATAEGMTNLGNELLAQADRLVLEAEQRVDGMELLADRIAAEAGLLNTRVNGISAQVADLLGADDYDPAESYANGDTVKADGHLYRSTGPVPVGAAPPDAAYWELLGDYSSLGEMVSAQALQISDLTTRVTETEQGLEAETEQRDTLAAQLRGDYEGTDPSMLVQGLLYRERLARVTDSEAFASDLNSLTSRIETAEGDVSAASLAVQDMQTQVVTLNGVTESHSGLLTSLRSDITDLTGTVDLKASASAVQSLDTRVTGFMDTLTAQATLLTQLETSVGDQQTSITELLALTEGQAQLLVTLRADADYHGSEITDLRSVTATMAESFEQLETTVGFQSSSITTLEQTTAAQATRMTDVEALSSSNQSRVTTVEGATASQGTRLTAVETSAAEAVSRVAVVESTTENAAGRLSTVETAVGNHTSSISDLQSTTSSQGQRILEVETQTADAVSRVGAVETTTADFATRVETVETNVGGYTSRIEAVEATTADMAQSVTSLETGGADNAAATAALTTRVDAAEGQLTNIATDLVSLNTSVAGKADSSAVSSLESRVVEAEGLVSSQGSAIIDLQSGLGEKADASAVSGLATRMTNAEGELESIASDLTSLNTAVIGKADSSALSSLDSRVTTAEGLVSSQGASITTLQGSLAGKADNYALQSLAQTVTDQGQTVTSQGTAITSLSATVNSDQSSLMPNPSVETNADWWPGGIRTANADAPPGCPTAYCMRVEARDLYLGKTISVKAGDRLYASASVASTGATSLPIGVGYHLMTAAGDHQWHSAARRDAGATNAWSPIAGFAIVPEGFIWAQPWIQIDGYYPETANQLWHITQADFRNASIVSIVTAAQAATATALTQTQATVTDQGGLLSSHSSQLTNLIARIGQAEADIVVERNTRSDGHTAQANQLIDLTATANTAFAKATDATVALATLGNQVKATRTIGVEAVAGGRYALASIVVGVEGDQTTLESKILMKADALEIWNGSSAQAPFAVTNGLVEMSGVTVRGDVRAATGTIGDVRISGGGMASGGFTSFSWPASGQEGFYLGPSGLLLGNANDNRYVHIGSNGAFYAPGLTIENGNATFSGKLSVKSGATGSRLEITEQLIRVYDANNVLRVRLGVW